jgi:hypothetical protein
MMKRFLAASAALAISAPPGQEVKSYSSRRSPASVPALTGRPIAVSSSISSSTPTRSNPTRQLIKRDDRIHPGRIPKSPCKNC